MVGVRKFEDGVFTFWTAHFGSWAGDRRVVFRVREDSTAEKRAAEKGIKFYDRLIPATDEEIVQWMVGHPTYVEVEV